MWVKICGTTNLEDALLAAEAGADAVGFVFAESARRVTTEQVYEITEQLPSGIEKVGVFSTDDPYEVEHCVACAGLSAAQLHGTFDGELVRLLPGEFGGELKIIQTVSYAAQASDQKQEDARFEEQLRAVLAEPLVWGVLLDTAVRGSSGGTGVAFDWERVGSILATVWPTYPVCKLIVAGGLRPDNVGQAIARLRPDGVDVASGVESSKGKKDAEKVRAFVAAARQALA